MKKLIAQVMNPLRSRDIVAREEAAIRGELVRVFNTVEAAYRAHDDHYRAGQVPGSEWDVKTGEAIDKVRAVSGLLPSERHIYRFRFED
jgi:hypothetical protein